MPAPFSQLLASLKSSFSNRFCLTRTQFQQYLGISRATEQRMLHSGQYPRVIWLGRAAVILLDDLAAWLAAGGASRERRCAPGTYAKADPKKRGRPKGSRNRPKNLSGQIPPIPPENTGILTRAQARAQASSLSDQ